MFWDKHPESLEKHSEEEIKDMDQSMKEHAREIVNEIIG